MAHTISDRGFRYEDPRKDTYGNEYRLYESSAATRNCLWLMALGGPNTGDQSGQEVCLHLDQDMARDLAERLAYFAEHGNLGDG